MAIKCASRSGVSNMYLNNDYRNYLMHADEDMKYGLHKKKKYPMPDRDHVMSAIKFFNYVSPADEKELARNIIARIREYGITGINVGENNRFRKYYNPEKKAGWRKSLSKSDGPILKVIQMNNYPENDYRSYLMHSAKGKEWEDHKYIAKINGRYFYDQDELDAYKRHQKEARQYMSKNIGRPATPEWEEELIKEYEERDRKKAKRKRIAKKVGNVLNTVFRFTPIGYGIGKTYDEIQKNSKK